MPENTDELKEEYPQYRLRIERMCKDGASFEEIESWIEDALTMDAD